MLFNITLNDTGTKLDLIVVIQIFLLHENSKSIHKSRWNMFYGLIDPGLNDTIDTVMHATASKLCLCCNATGGASGG